MSSGRAQPLNLDAATKPWPEASIEDFENQNPTKRVRTNE